MMMNPNINKHKHDVAWMRYMSAILQKRLKFNKHESDIAEYII